MVTSTTEHHSCSVPHMNLSISCFAHVRASLEIPTWMWSSAALVCPCSVVLIQVVTLSTATLLAVVCRCARVPGSVSVSWQCQCVLAVQWKPQRLCTADCNLLQSLCVLTLWYQNKKICARDTASVIAATLSLSLPFTAFILFFSIQSIRSRFCCSVP